MTDDLMRMIDMYATLMQVLLVRRMEAAEGEVDELYTSIRTAEEQQGTLLRMCYFVMAAEEARKIVGFDMGSFALN